MDDAPHLCYGYANAHILHASCGTTPAVGRVALCSKCLHFSFCFIYIFNLQLYLILRIRGVSRVWDQDWESLESNVALEDVIQPFADAPAALSELDSASCG